MRNYDFSVLSPDEFERLSRDLLQKELHITLESFKQGKDQGVDARYSQDKTTGIIVQAKRYDSYSSLLSTLKKEVNKVKALKPRRYILTTSVGLSPKNKQNIVDLFKPFIKKNSDVYGRDDLNNLLNRFSEVESDYFKLWISSTEVLKKILHNSIHTQSFFDVEDIRSDVKKYVVNPSLTEAEKILHENRVVIISGIPGIGKTTLAKALCYRLTAKSKQAIQFVSVRQNIKEGYGAYEDSLAQLFFFDDFLGSNFLINNLERNEDKSILQFIENIGKSNNKYLICTTREYILQQAKQTYEQINKNPLIDLSKYVIDLETYTLLIKAKILYNHLFFSNLTIPYFTQMVSNKNYLKIIKHPNFNPRVLELITKDEFIDKTPPENFVSKFIYYLDNPENIWKDAYESQISDIARAILLVLVSCDSPIIYGDLFEATRTYIKQNYSGFSYSSTEFDRALRELERTFIQIKNEKTAPAKEEFVINFQNPSVTDFLRNYIFKHGDLIEKLTTSAVFLNQIFGIFSIRPNLGKIDVGQKLLDLMISKIIRDFNSLSFSTLTKIYYSEGDYLMRRSAATPLDKIVYILSHVDLSVSDNLTSFALSIFCNIAYSDINDSTIDNFILLTRAILPYSKKMDAQNILETIAGNLCTVAGIKTFYGFSDIFSDEFIEFITDHDNKQRLTSIIREEISNSTFNYESFYDFSSFNDDANEVANIYNLDIDDELIQLQEEVSEREAQEDQAYDLWEDQYKEDDAFKRTTEREESEAIDSLFTSLIK